MYSECVRCQRLGQECDGPNFVAMPPQELIAWCKERKKHMGLTNAKLAELTGMSQGTIDSLLANTHADFKFGTIGPLLRVLVGGKWAGDPCADPTGTAGTELQEKIRTLESEIKHRDETIKELRKNNESLEKLVANTNARLTKDKDFLRDQLRGRNKAVGVLSLLLTICLLVIIGALIVDRFDPTKGFFWLGDLAQLFNSSSLGGLIA